MQSQVLRVLDPPGDGLVAEPPVDREHPRVGSSLFVTICVIRSPPPSAWSRPSPPAPARVRGTAAASRCTCSRRARVELPDQQRSAPARCRRTRRSSLAARGGVLEDVADPVLVRRTPRSAHRRACPGRRSSIRCTTCGSTSEAGRSAISAAERIVTVRGSSTEMASVRDPSKPRSSANRTPRCSPRSRRPPGSPPGRTCASPAS